MKPVLLTVDDALEKYRCKLQKKKHNAALSKVSLTGSGVCYSFIHSFYTHHSLQDASVAIHMAAIDEDNTLELELEHEIPSPKDTCWISDILEYSITQ